METNDNKTSPTTGKTGIENLSKDELINKYKGLLSIAKKAKQAKDELAEENRVLKETLLRNETQQDADKKALLTMKETLEQFTEQKLQLSTQLEELRTANRNENAELSKLRIENESLRRQMDSLTTDNETLLNEIDAMEDKLKIVNLIGIEQKKHLELVEVEVNRLKESECQNASLQQRLEVSLTENKALKEQENASRKLIDELTNKYKNLKEINTSQRHKFNGLKDRFVDVHRKLLKLKECKRILLETQQEYADAVSKWQNEIIQASRQLCVQLNTLQIENVELMKQLKAARGKNDGEQGGSLLRFARQLEELNNLANIAVGEQDQQNVLVEQLQNENKKILENEKYVWQEIVNDLDTQKLENKRLVQEIGDLKTKLESNEETAQSSRESYNALKMDDRLKEEQEKLELENTLQHLKHALEIKSTAVSQLESELETTKARLSDYDALKKELNSCRQSYEELLSRFELKEREHGDLLAEMRELNEALKARGDVISRQEEKHQELTSELKRNIARLQQSEQVLKDNEQEKQQLKIKLTAAETQVRDLEAACVRSNEQIAVITEELESLKQNNTNFDAQSDVISIASTTSRAEELNRMREVDESFEERYNKLRALAVKLKRKLQEQTNHTNELERQLKARDALQTELEDYKSKVAELAQQQQMNETILAENKKLKSSRKQANVLSLEIEAAEKSLNEVSSKLAGKIAELGELKTVLETKESTIVQLRKEIAILEAAKASECEHGKELKSQIDRLNAQIKDALHAKQIANDNSKGLEHAQEELKLELEDLRLQLAQSASKQETSLQELRTQNLNLNSKLAEMEALLSTTQTALKTCERSLEDMRVEYTEYKIKAQAVLRKNQKKDITREHELEEELLSLRLKTQQLEIHGQTLSRKSEDYEKQIQELQEDNASLRNRNKELTELVDELRLQNDAMMQEQRMLLQTQQDTLREQRKQFENLEVCHRDQIEIVERDYQLQIEQLKADLSKATRQPPIIGAVAKLPPNFGAESFKSGVDLLLMEREDAEGSEEATANTLATLAAKRKISNASSSRRSLHDFMPLDELLNAPLNALNSETVLSTTSAMLADNSNGNVPLDSAEHMELQAAKERLQIQESRLRHLTALLAENEQDLAKLTQMNDMLKEELRRQERSVEREQHMHNSEYLKNVFIKFLTLNSVDEKTRLVPVLNTILKLSRSETEMLNCVAKGQKVSEPSTRSWSNFLPSWGGGGGGNGN